MEIKIKNYRGCKSAEFSIEKLAVIFGDNRQGKSSMMQAITSAVIGDPTGGAKLTKAQLQLLVNRGANGASVDVDGAKVSLPSGDVKNAPGGSEFSLFKCPLSLDKKATADFFSVIAGTDPSEEDWKEALLPTCGKAIDKVMAKLQSSGADTASDYYQQQATLQKGVWKGIAKTAYGNKKADGWRPDNFNPGLESESEERLKNAVATAQSAVDSAIAQSGFEDAKIEQWQEDFHALDENRELLKSHEELSKNLSIEIKSLNLDIFEDTAELKKLSIKTDPLTCPACGIHLELKNNSLTADTSDPCDNSGKIVDLESNIARNKERRDTLEIELRKVMDNASKARERVRKGEEADEYLAEYQQKAKSLSGSAVDLNTARNELKFANDNLQAFTDWKAAEKAFNTVVYYETVSKILAPDGLRKEKLSEGLEKLNSEIESRFPGNAFRVEPDLTIWFNGFPLALCAESEQWVCSVILRLIHAEKKGDRLLLIDRLDILSNTRKSDLLKCLLKSKVKVIAFSTAAKKEDAADLWKVKGCGSYWIEDGFLTEYHK